MSSAHDLGVSVSMRDLPKNKHLRLRVVFLLHRQADSTSLHQVASERLTTEARVKEQTDRLGKAKEELHEAESALAFHVASDAKYYNGHLGALSLRSLERYQIAMQQYEIARDEFYAALKSIKTINEVTP